MAEPRKHGKKKSVKTERSERRFAPSGTYTSRLAAAVGIVGGAGLGMGVYGMWIRPEQVSYAPYLLAGGLLLLIGALFFGDADAVPVRVGDAGVAFEHGNEFARLAWCDLRKISIEDGVLVVAAEAQSFRVGLAALPQAVTTIVSEAKRRVPKVVAVSEDALRELPAAADSLGEKVPLLAVQIAGRRCKASDKAIAFERDARLCPNCGQVYHRDHVPASCLTCEEKLGERAFGVPS